MELPTEVTSRRMEYSTSRTPLPCIAATSHRFHTPHLATHPLPSPSSPSCFTSFPPSPAPPPPPFPASLPSLRFSLNDWKPGLPRREGEVEGEEWEGKGGGGGGEGDERGREEEKAEGEGGVRESSSPFEKEERRGRARVRLGTGRRGGRRRVSREGGEAEVGEVEEWEGERPGEVGRGWWGCRGGCCWERSGKDCTRPGRVAVGGGCRREGRAAGGEEEAGGGLGVGMVKRVRSSYPGSGNHGCPTNGSAHTSPGRLSPP